MRTSTCMASRTLATACLRLDRTKCDRDGPEGWGSGLRRAGAATPAQGLASLMTATALVGNLILVSHVP